MQHYVTALYSLLQILSLHTKFKDKAEEIEFLLYTFGINIACFFLITMMASVAH
jgi:hypothetical protein